MNRKQREFEQRKNLIIEAAENLFLKKGYEKTTMNQIATQAEFSKMTLYAYFSSKDEIYLTVLAKNIRKRWQFQKEQMEKAVNGLAKIRAFAESYYTYFQANPGFLRLQIYLDVNGISVEKIKDTIFNDYHQFNIGAIDEIRSAFQQGLEDGSLRPDLPIETTMSHLFYALRMILNKALFPAYSFGSFDSHEYYFNFVNIFINGIKNINK